MYRSLQIVILVFIFAFTGCKKDESPREYYRYTPSEKGKEYRLVTYDLLGFRLDIPINYQISITGLSSLDVAVIHPIGQDNSSFSEDWEVFEIGELPYTDISLEQAMDMVAEGYRHKHSNVEDIEPFSSFMISDHECLSWKVKWASKTGLTVYECVVLLKYRNEIRSIGVKSCSSAFLDRTFFYSDIIKTYVPFEKVIP